MMRCDGSAMKRMKRWGVRTATVPSGRRVRDLSSSSRGLTVSRAESSSLPVRIDDRWVELGAWKRAHPAGLSWLEMFRGKDATEVFYAFHSELAQSQVARLPPYKGPMPPADIPDPTPLQRDFRNLRVRLKEEGWFERDWKFEAANLSAYAFLVVSAIAMAHCQTMWMRALAFLPLGTSFCYSAWLAHDYIHGRGKLCKFLRNIGSWSSGFSATMWVDKHNVHHAMTNIMGTDNDLSAGPFLWLWSPDPKNDKRYRGFQHLYVGFLFSLLHAVWRFDSLKVAWDRKVIGELVPIAVHYVVSFALFPWHTFLLGILFGGLLMANITSATHQSEDLLEEYDHDWVRLQFNTTRDARCGNFFSEWMWGGMQYQLEHHLFPTMPRYKYPALVPEMEALARRHGVGYRVDSDLDLIKRNYATYARVAREVAVPGAPGRKVGVSL